MNLGERFSAVGVALIFVGMVIGGGLGFLVMGGSSASPDQVGERVVSLLEQQSGQDYELLNVDKQNGFYRINIQDSNNQVITYYSSTDGESITSSVTDLNQLEQTVAARQDFVNCLNDNNVTFYGNITQQATQLQIQALGGANFVSSIYKDVNSPQNLREAAQRGIQRIPSFYVDGEVLSGVNQVSAIESFSGCNLEVPESGQ